MNSRRKYNTRGAPVKLKRRGASSHDVYFVLRSPRLRRLNEGVWGDVLMSNNKGRLRGKYGVLYKIDGGGGTMYILLSFRCVVWSDSRPTSNLRYRYIPRPLDQDLLITYTFPCWARATGGTALWRKKNTGITCLRQCCISGRKKGSIHFLLRR